MKENKNIKNLIFTPACNTNLVIWVMSSICFPISKLFATYKISPNLITVLSFILIIISCSFLLRGNLILFSLTFIFSILLDFCDGQVARILKKSNDTKFDFDHLSDIIKISIIYLTFGILFDEFYSWIFFFISYLLFFSNIYLHSSVVNAEKAKSNLLKNKKIKFTFFKYFKLNIFMMIYKIIIPLVTTFNAHSLFLILLILIDIKMIYVVFLYFNFVFIFRIFKNSKKLLNTKK